MLDRRWIAAQAVLAIAAVVFDQPLLAFCTSISLLVTLSLVVSHRYCLVGVSYRRRLGTARAQHGQVVELAGEIVNLKVLPVPLLEIEDQLPRDLPIEGSAIRPGREHLLPSLSLVRSLLPYERITTRWKVRCVRRGEYEFGPARWRSGDYLGLRTLHGAANDTERLLILPKVLPLAVPPPLARELLGARATRARLFADPLRIAGRRDYAPGDPLRSVDWRATARRDVLTVRQLESSTTQSFLIGINFSVHAPAGDRYAPDELEFAICVAASIAEHGWRRGWRTGLIGNSTAGAVAIQVPPSNAPAQRSLIQETLARASTIPTEPLGALLLRRARSACDHESLVVITTAPDDALSEALIALYRRGHALVAI